MLTGNGTWSPILTNDLRTEAMASVEEIAAVLLPSSEPTPTDDASLAGGSAGIALFFSALHAAFPDHRKLDSERALDHLTNAVGALAGKPLGASLYSGFTGIAWVTDYLDGRLFLSDDEDPNADIDRALASHLEQTPWHRDYDLVGGLVGHGVYALDRKDRAAQTSLLTSVIQRLSEIAVVTAEGTTWHTPPHLLVQWQRDLYPNGYYNLGLAHGVPGVIALLSQACAADIAVELARPLLYSSIPWLLSQERDNPCHESCFPTVVLEGHDDQKSARVSWCYGDLGIALTLLAAARIAGETSWERRAIDIAMQAARRSENHSGVLDAGLCHGAAGNGHLFNRLYHATGEARFKETAVSWYSRALEYRRPGEGLAGYRAWIGANGGQWREYPGLLEGIAGIGLALLAATTPVEPDWDRMLMVSVPPA